MNLKRYFVSCMMLFFFLILGSSACNYFGDNTEEIIARRNSDPTIEVIANGVGYYPEYKDTVKQSGIVGQFALNFSIKVKDINANLNNIPIGGLPVSNSFLVQLDSSLVNLAVDKINQDADSLEIAFEAFFVSVGNYHLKFTVIDDFGKKDSASVFVHSYENLPPVVLYDTTTSLIHPSVKVIDLSKSFDQDSQYGGEVVTYNYLLDGQHFEFATPVLKYSFPRSNDYEVTVYVEDNNRDSSEHKHFTLNVMF